MTYQETQQERQALAARLGWQIESVEDGVAIKTVTPEGVETFGLPSVLTLRRQALALSGAAHKAGAAEGGGA